MNIKESFDLQHYLYSYIPCVFVPGSKQPAIDFLTLIFTGLFHIVEVSFRMLIQIIEYPEFKRMHPRDIALIWEVIFFGAVLVI